MIKTTLHSDFFSREITEELKEVFSEELLNQQVVIQNKNLINEHYLNKKSTKYLCSTYKSGGKIILYTPTWRQYKYTFPLLE